MGEQRSQKLLRFELEKWHEMETGLAADVSCVKTERGPRAGRVKNWHSHHKGKMKTGWFTGSWASGDAGRCLFHPQTDTAVSLTTGEDPGHFSFLWNTEDRHIVVDIDNADFCIDPRTIVIRHRLNDTELEAAIGDKLRLVLAGNSPPDPSQKLKFKPATIYMDTSTMQQVAIVGSCEHSNLKSIKHVLAAEVKGDRAANIDNIYKAQKEHLKLVRTRGRQRHCNVDEMLADIRQVYFPSFATSPEEIRDVLGGYAAAVAVPAFHTANSEDTQGNEEREAIPSDKDRGPIERNEQSQKVNPAQRALLLQNQDMQAGLDPPTCTTEVLELLSDIEKNLVMDMEEFKRLKLERECIICMNALRSYAFLPCGHLAVCTKCAKYAFEICPMCRQPVKDHTKIYFN
ncbi:uncharacterized protein LOC144924673 isoform X2 [Branchiostoma floridae x Branchiostoma belcheri]